MERIYIVSEPANSVKNFFEIVKKLLVSGYSFFQLREKTLPASEVYEIGKKIIGISSGRKVKLVINDRLDVALALGAYGVQITEASLAPDVVKKISGRLKIGLSVHNEQRIKEFEKYCDFFVAGNIFTTESKKGVSGKGVDFLSSLVGITKKPVYGIGGINSSNTKELMCSGCYGVALKGAVFNVANPIVELKKISKIIIGSKFKRSL